MSERLVSLLLTTASRGLLLRDRVNGDLGRFLSEFPYGTQQFLLRSGSRELAAVFVSAGEDTPVFVICHGIGERIEYWAKVQEILQQMGFSSLVFNYTGFGSSPGRISTASCEQDGIAAIGEARRRRGSRVFLLGFSLGTAVATAIAAEAEVDGIVLCEGFTSLEEAACIVGLPRRIARISDGVWKTEHRIAGLKLPVLIVHSTDDGLFPVEMAKRITCACGEYGEEILCSGFRHNDPIFDAPKEYWQPIAAWANRRIEEKRLAQSTGIGSSDTEGSGPPPSS